MFIVYRHREPLVYGLGGGATTIEGWDGKVTEEDG
jgi:hypothetical protein